MKLSDYCGKKVNLTLKEGEVLRGKVIEYTRAIDNDPEIDSIDIEVKDKIYEIYENEIKSIEIL